MTLQERITRIEAQIAASQVTMNAILTAANVEIAEHLTGVNAEAWSAEHTAMREMFGYLQRIESVLNSCERYMVANVL